MNLPEKFITKYEQILGEHSHSFFDALEESSVSAFRTNPLKKSQESFYHHIPNTKWGYYGKISGKSYQHVSGLVYSQEPAAQMVGQIANPNKGQRVLDLAAAPGGKSTHLLSYLDNTGILISNEISKKRSKILVENIERFGARNCIVTNESAERLAKTLPEFFDIIVFDGPCSGEGMFRKDPDAIQYWTEDYPNQCADLQKSILVDAMKMIAPGGILVYSTCTWAPEENEEVVQWLLDTYDYLELVVIPKINGMVEGIDMPQVARMYPHHFRGEGQFVAKLVDTRTTKSKSVKQAKSNLSKQQQKLWEDFAEHHLKTILDGILQVFGDYLYLVPHETPDLSKLKIARNGLHLGRFKKNRFEPSFALGLALSADDVHQVIDIDIEQFKHYASGNVVSLEKTYPTGWYLVLIKGNSVGFAKVVGSTLKNYFPKGLRFSS